MPDTAADFDPAASGDQEIDRSRKMNFAAADDAIKSGDVDAFLSATPTRTTREGPLAPNVPWLPAATGGEPPSNAQVDQMSAGTAQFLKNQAGDNIRAALPARAPPPMPEPPPSPEAGMRHALSAFSNPLMWLALGGSMLTRRPAINALTAAGGLLEGMNERDYRRAYLQQHKFRNSVKETLAQQQRELADELAILNDPKMSAADKLANLGAVVDANQDPTLARFIKQGDLGSVQNILSGRQQFVQHGRKATDRFTAAAQRIEKLQAELDPENIKAIAEYRQKPSTNPMVMNEVRKLKPDYDEKEWQRESGEAKRKPGGETISAQKARTAREAVDSLISGTPASYGGFEFTPADLKELRDMTTAPVTGLSPKQRMLARIMEQAGLRPPAAATTGAAPAAAGARTAPAVPPGAGTGLEDSLPLPSELVDKPDGTEVRNKLSGRIYFKRGERMYPKPQGMLQRMKGAIESVPPQEGLIEGLTFGGGA